MQAGSVTLGSSATASHMYLRNAAANSVKAQGRGCSTYTPMLQFSCICSQLDT